MKDRRKGSRWDMTGLGIAPTPRQRPARWRSHDLKGPLPARITRALQAAINSLPSRGPWPEIDEDAWWQDVLSDRRLRRSKAERLSDRHEDAGLRLDRLPTKSLTFACQWCGERATLTIEELFQMFGPDRNVRTVGRHVLKFRDRAGRREGEECPITYQV